MISTHAPLAGRDRSIGTSTGTGLLFQPTRPLRGATTLKFFVEVFVYISTHAPLAGRDKRFTSDMAGIAISTHAPLAGRDS